MKYNIQEPDLIVSKSPLLNLHVQCPGGKCNPYVHYDLYEYILLILPTFKTEERGGY